jgi:cytidylate kinase
MTTITISREFGSDGRRIAEQVAEKLGYEFIDKPILEKVFRQYGLTKFGDLYSSAPSIWDLASANNLLIVSILNELMEALAYRGNVVILGRGGFASLNDYADVLNIRIQAPLADRVERVMDREVLDDRQQAEAKVKADDKARRRFVKMFYNKEIDEETYFNLVIDTGTVSIEMAINWIIEAARSIEQKEFGAGAVTTRKIKPDPVLLDAIEEAKANPLPPLPDVSDWDGGE